MEISFDPDNPKWITTDEELRAALGKCSKCNSMTGGGTYIIPWNMLDDTKFDVQHNFCVIINTLDGGGSETAVGHWICLSVNVFSRQAVLFDPLDSLYRTHPAILSKVTSFCNKRNVKFNYLFMKTQQYDSMACGIHILWFIHRIHEISIEGMLKIKKMFKDCLLKNVERYVMLEVSRRF